MPAFADHVRELLALTAAEEASLSKLTNLILKSVSLSAKMLRLANSVQYNRSGRRILSVSHAITLLGWEAVRDLASGMHLFEHFRQGPAGLRELMVLSLLTANHARQASLLVHYPQVEEAYLCGMFRNLGELLVAAYMPSQYAQIMQKMSLHHSSASQECLPVLGFDYDDLGRAMVRQWNLSDKVAWCIGATNSASAGARSQNDLLRTITEFSHALSHAVYRNGTGSKSAALEDLLRKHGRLISLKQNDLETILKPALEDTADTFRVAQVPLDHLRLEAQVQAVISGAADSGVELSESISPAVESPAGHPLEQLASEVEAVLASGSDFDLNDVLMMILEGVYGSGHYERILVCLVNPERTQVRGRLGVGVDVDRVIELFRFPISIRNGPIATAILSRRDVFAGEDTISQYARSYMLSVLKTSSFALLPVVVDNIVVACLYFDGKKPEPHFPEDHQQALCRLRDCTAAAISRKRNTAP